MNFQVENAILTVYEPSMSQVECPLDGDFLLPEYCPDMAAVLKCTVTPMVMTRQWSGDKLLIDGQSHIRILYLDEGRNCVRSYECVEPFGCAVQGAGDVLPKVTVRVNYMNCRAVSPRRVGVHGALTVLVYRDVCRTEQVIGDVCGRDVYTRKEKVCQTVPLGAAEKMFSIAEMVDLGGGKPAAQMLIRTDAKPLITSIKQLQGKIIIKGRVLLKTLYGVSGQNGECARTEHEFPFSHILEMEGMSEGVQVKGAVYTVHDDVQLAADQNGNCTLLNVNMKFCLRVEAFEQQEVTVVTDAYMRKFPCHTAHTELSCEGLLFVRQDTYTVKEVLSMPSEKVEDVLDLWCDQVSVLPAKEKDAWYLGGELHISMLTKDQDGSISYYENTSEYRLQTEDICDDVKADVMLSDMEYAIVGGKIEIRINLMVCREGYTRNTHKPLLEFRQQQEPYPEERAALRICRVKKGESLWEIAKESHTDMAIVKAENKLTDDVVPQDMMLLVPLR